MPRFILVRGREGVLVPNPHAIGASPMRFAGMKHNPAAPPGPLVSLYEPCDEVLLDSADLRSAAKAGDLTLMRDCIADNHDAARGKLATPPAKPARSAPEVK